MTAGRTSSSSDASGLNRRIEGGTWRGIESSSCVFRKQCGKQCGAALAIEHCGDLYSCDHFVYPQNRLGNIMDSSLETLVHSDRRRSFGEAKESTKPRGIAASATFGLPATVSVPGIGSPALPMARLA